MAGRVIAALVFAASVSSVAAQETALREGRSAVRRDWLDRVERSRQDSAAFIGAAVDAFRLRHMRMDAAAAHAPPARVPASYFEDPTLRFGDVIAVDGRLIVFRGAAGATHRPADFEELGRAVTLGGVHDGELRAIDRVLARGVGR